MENKSKWPLVFGITIPIALVVALVIFIYFPLMSLKAQYNFVYYSTDNSSSCYRFNPYQVVNGKIEKTPLPVVSTSSSRSYDEASCLRLYGSSRPTLYLFDVTSNSYRKISFEEAQSWQISSDSVSPDNIKVSDGYDSAGFEGLFGGGSRGDSLWLEGQKGNKEINLFPSVSSYYQFKFVGWIIK